jgi:hypothetical protein
MTSNGVTFTVISPPNIASLSPTSGAVGTAITITGTNFGTTQGSVSFNGAAATTLGNWSDTSITAQVPNGATTGPVTVTANGMTSNGVTFTIGTPTITGVSPTTGAAGVQVTVSGSGFGSAQGTGAVWLGSAPAAVVSWSDTQIVATVASNAMSGSARVRQGGAWSNAVPFTVNTATIATVTPASGVPGTQVTIAGSGFGAAQGGGQVWLGTANAVVQTWSDTQIVALVASGSASGNALVLQNGVMSNAVPFAVNTLHLTSIDPNSGAAATSATFTGAGFGSVQGSGVAWLGSIAGQVVSWSDTQIVATVASTAVTGIARVQQNGVWSNALAFTVPSENGVTLMPSLLNLMVGDTHAIQALSAAGQPVTGLTWTSSDATVVSLSSDDPPLLTAVAAGHVTITAGTASADVTVSSSTDFPGGLPVGTVLWSHPGDVYSIVPAVPSPSGVADVFAFQNDGTVQAITSDGTTAWTAYVGDAQVLPDFQGGLVVLSDGSLVKLEGISGQALTLYSAEPRVSSVQSALVHADGTVFAVEYRSGTDDLQHIAVLGIDSKTGAQKFSVPLPGVDDYDHGKGFNVAWFPIIAGDGYFYLPYRRIEWDSGGGVGGGHVQQDDHIGVLRVNSSGMSDDISVYDRSGASYEGPGPNGDFDCDELEDIPLGLGTNADTGVVLTWSEVSPAAGACPRTQRMAITSGTSASLVNAPEIPGQVQPVMPDVQLQDGTFIGLAVDDTSTVYMVAFDQAGGVKWSLPNYYPLIATADGGVIASSDWVAATSFDQNGNATGQIANVPTYSWKGAYLDGDLLSIIPMLDLASIISTKSFAAAPGGNLASNGFSLQHHTFGLWFSGPEGNGAPDPAVGPLTPIIFSYLAEAGLNEGTYTTAVDFSEAHPEWVVAIRNEAVKTYMHAFDSLPAISGRTPKPELMRGQIPAPLFERTIYVTGWWGKDDHGNPVTGLASHIDDKPWGWLYYPVIMGSAQVALETNWVHLSPPYPPTTSADFTQFGQLMKAIGHAIGTIAAHETGHLLHVEFMDCNAADGKHDPCPEDYLYQNFASGPEHEWFYEDVQGKAIHWTANGKCDIRYYLLHSRFAAQDGQCQ